MKIDVTRIVEHADGGATFTLTLDYEALIAMARNGIEAALLKAVSKEQVPGGSEEVHGEFPGF